MNLVSFFSLILLLIGAQLQSLKSALICPDWPLCYGEFVPLYFTPLFYEWTKRVILLALFTSTFIQLRKNKNYLLFFLSLCLMLLELLIQSQKLPTLTTVLGVSLLLLIFFFNEKERSFPEIKESRWDSSWKDFLGFYLFFLTTQFFLGAILRRSSLLASCEQGLSFLSCLEAQASIPLAGPLSVIHRFFGLTLLFVGLFLFSYFLPVFKKFSIVALLLILGQFFLGIKMGRASGRELVFYHSLLGTLLFTHVTLMLFYVRKQELARFGSILATKINDIIDLFKPRLTTLVVVSLLVGVFLAPFRFNIILLIASLVGIWLMAAGSLALNCYLEREQDKSMERTKSRPLPSGRLKPEVALYWGWSFVFLGFVIVALVGNFLTAALGFLAVILYLYLYTPLKLKTPYALYWGAIPGAIPALMGWTLVHGEISSYGLFLFALLTIWQIPHFLAISLYRRAEYEAADFLTFAQTHSERFIWKKIIFFSFFLLLVGMIPTLAGQKGFLFLIMGMLPSAILIFLSLYAFFGKAQISQIPVSRIYFFSTLFHLSFYLIALLIMR